MAAKDGEVVCGLCSKLIAGINPISCDYCKALFHAKCLELPDPLFKALMKKKPASILIQCPDCKVTSVPARPDDFRLKEVVNKLAQLDVVDTKLDILCSRLDLILDDIPASESADKKSYSEALSTGVGSKSLFVNGTSAVTAFKVNKEIEENEQSIIVMGLPENGEDLAAVKQLCLRIDNSAVPKDAFRLGRLKVQHQLGAGLDNVKESPQRIRPVKVLFSSAGVAKSVLSNAKVLKSDDTYKTVFIRKFLNKDELAALFKLRDKRDEMNKANTDRSTKFAILNEKLVKFINCTPLGKGEIDKSFKPENVFLSIM